MSCRRRIKAMQMSNEDRETSVMSTNLKNVDVIKVYFLKQDTVGKSYETGVNSCRT